MTDGADLDDGVFADSPAMRDVVTRIAGAAHSRDGVLVVGETGTGRRTVARAIHRGRRLAGAPLVEVDCANGAPHDLGPQLFGTHAGVDDAAAGNRRRLEPISSSSRLAQARGGTLLLRNLEAMPSREQARLARLLRDDEAWTIDGKEAVTLDVRTIATADPTIEGAVQDERVRPDLWRLLAADRIDLPPLRERREDIPALVSYFLARLCAAAGVEPKMITYPALTLLAALPYRGNVSELRQMVQTLVTRVPGRTVRLEDLLAHLRLDTAPVSVGVAGSLREARSRFERQYISAVLRQHRGRVADAARALGIQRTNLYRKIRTLGISLSAPL
jgi:DNA-binding NtrC family response regulator